VGSAYGSMRMAMRSMKISGHKLRQIKRLVGM